MAYIISGQCGVVRLDPRQTGIVSAESAQYSSKVTSNPVESGSDINDHVVTNPEKYTVTGVTIGGNAVSILNQMWKMGDILEYAGRIHVSSCVITDLKQDISAKNRDGVSFTLQLQVVNITSAGYVPTGELLMSMQDAGAGTSAAIGGTNQTKATAADGLKTTTAQTISASAYTNYVKGYASKPAGSSGPSSRKQASFSAA